MSNRPAPSSPSRGTEASQRAENQPSLDNHDDRRRHSRVSYRLKARYLDEAGEERPCVVANISAGGAMVRAKKTPNRGEKVVLYIDGIGRFEGQVVRAGKHAFAVHYKARRAKTQRTADALIRVLNRGQRAQDRRNMPRIEMERPVIVTQKDGSQIECTILDVSLTGASISIDPQPPLGTEMIVGRMKARVVRRHEVGVGLVFLGSAKHMEDVINQTADISTKSDTVDQDWNRSASDKLKQEITDVGTEIASHFGKKENHS